MFCQEERELANAYLAFVDAYFAAVLAWNGSRGDSREFAFAKVRSAHQRCVDGREALGRHRREHQCNKFAQ